MKTSYFITFVLFVFIMGCTSDEIVSEKEYAFVKTHPVEILSDGAVFKAEMLNKGSENIQKYGFVWGESSGPTTIDNFMAFDEDTGNGIFTFELHSGLKKEKTYFVRAYAKNFFYETYGNEVSFLSNGSLPPVIEKFSPDYGPIGTKVIIEGKNFAFSKTTNLVKLGDNIAVIDSFSENRLVVNIAQILKPEKVKISVEAAGMLAFSEKEFDLWFPWKRKNNHPVLHEYASSCVHKNKSYIVTPNSNMLFLYDPLQDFWDQIILPVNSGIPFIFSNNERIFAQLKDSFWEFFPESETWIEKKKFPGQIDDRVSLNYSFSLNNKLFIGNCYQSFALWEYSIDDDTWIRKTDMPDVDGLIYYTSCNYTFISENKGYVGIVKSFPEKNALWEYNPESDKWIKKSGLSEDSYRGITAFVINGEAFAGLGNRTYSDFPSKSIWKYYNSDWIKYQDCPMGLAISTSFVIQNKGYVLSYETNDYYTRHTLWEFDPSKN